MKMGSRNIQKAIDLSGLGLDKIEETEEEFRIGCMTTSGTWNCIRGWKLTPEAQ